MAKKLTRKQAIFVKEYMVDFNATQASIRAGYSKKNADKIGSILLGKIGVKEEIDRLIEKRNKKLEMKADDVLNELIKIARLDIKDFVDFRTEKVLAGTEAEKTTGCEVPVFEYRQIVEMKPSDQVDGTMIKSVSISPKGVLTFELHDRMAALDKLGRHHKLFTDKVEHTGKDGGPIETKNSALNELTVEELRAIAHGGSKKPE